MKYLGWAGRASARRCVGIAVTLYFAAMVPACSSNRVAATADANDTCDQCLEDVSDEASDSSVADALVGGESVVISSTCDPMTRLSPEELVTAVDVVYATMGGVELRLDFAAPRGDGPYPLVVAIHGGGWSAGD